MKKVITGNVILKDIYLTSLPEWLGEVDRIDGIFDCSGNQLTSLKNSPRAVLGCFYCDRNQLTSLEGAPEEVIEVVVRLASEESGIPMDWGYMANRAIVFSPGDRAKCRSALALATPRSDIQKSEWFI
jgi:hypothetical protein